MAFPPVIVQHARTERYNTKSGQSVVEGSLVYLDATPEINLCGADPAAILGVALNPAAQVPDETTTLVALAEEGARFWMSGTSNPTAANVNVAYGVVNTSGVWQVDITDTTNHKVYVEAIDTTRNLFLVTVEAAARQHAA